MFESNIRSKLMAVATSTDVAGPDEWRIDDEIAQLRVWGSDTAYPLPDRSGDWTIGAAESCWLPLSDPTGRISRQHARLVRQDGRWGLKDLRSKNGVREDGVRRDAFPLAPGVEIGLGGVTLIAESPRLCALREVLARLLGWSEQRRGDVDLAVRAVRAAATRSETLLLCGPGDLVAIARHLHRHGLGDDRPFVVADPRRRRTDCNARMAANFDDARSALAAATGGTLCVWHDRQPAGFADVVRAIRGRTARAQLVVCSHALAHGESLIASPIVIPPLEWRASELDRIIDAYVADARADLGGTWSAVDHEWVRRHEAATLPEIEVATRRLVALRATRGSLAHAARRLEMSRPALAEWVSRRSLPAMVSET